MASDRWKNALKSCFEEMHIIATCQKEAVEKFRQFCEFIAEPAFEVLSEELKSYRIRARYLKIQKNTIDFQLNFPNSREDNFHYTLFLPKNSVQLILRIRVRGRKNTRSPWEENEGPFMENVAPADILKLEKEDLIQDIIEHFKDFNFRVLTSPDK